MDKLLEYLPEVITALWGLFTGILLEKVNANKEKRLDIYKLRKDLYIEITKLISNIPPANCNIEDYNNYYNDLFCYYDEHTTELVLISNTKIANLLTKYIKLLGTYVDKKEWNAQNRDKALKIAQKLINKMRRKLLSLD